MTVEMLWFFTFHNPKLARSTCFFTSNAWNSVDIILSEKSLVSFFNHTFCDEHDIDWVRKIGEDCNEGFGHFASHVEILILILKQINCMRDFTIRSKVLHDLPIDKEEDFNLILRKISVDIFVIKFYGGIKERLPSFLWFGHFTDFNGMVKNLFNFDVMCHFFIKVDLILIDSLSQYWINSFHCYFNCFDRCTWFFIKILKTIVNFLLLTYFYALIDWKIGVVFEGIKKLVWFHFSHQLNILKNRFLWKFVFGYNGIFILAAANNLL